MSSPRYCKAWRIETSRTGKFRVPCGPVAARIQLWLNEGFSFTQIAAAAGCNRRTLSVIVSGKNPNCHRDIARRVMAVRLNNSAIPEYLPVDATGTRRRLQALMAIGHSLVSMARELGHTVGALSKIANGHYPNVRGTTARAVADLYRRWAVRPGHCPRSRTRAAAEGWPGPMAWDRNIDDPAATPDLTYAQAA